MENGSYDAILGAHHPSRLHTTRPGPSDHPDRPTMTAHSDASQKGPKGLNCSKKNHAPRTFPVPLRLWSAFAPQHPQKHPESFRSPAISHDPGSHRRHHPLECQPEGTQRTKLLQKNPCTKRIPPSDAPPTRLMSPTTSTGRHSSPSRRISIPIEESESRASELSIFAKYEAKLRIFEHATSSKNRETNNYTSAPPCTMNKDHNLKGAVTSV